MGTGESDWCFLMTPATSASVVGYLAVTVGAVVVLGVYFLPSLIAFQRDPPHKGSVLVINCFFGWTLLGWVISLAMACRALSTPPIASQSVAPPGWYADPTTGRYRWWTGREWGPPV
jgi:hypothetical protein